MTFTSSGSHLFYEMFEPEIEQFLDDNNIKWTDLVEDPTAYTDQEAKETAVKMFWKGIPN